MRYNYMTAVIVIATFTFIACSQPPGSGSSSSASSQASSSSAGWTNGATNPLNPGIMRGINLGNTLDATPTEGSWTGGLTAQSWYFDAYTNAGFNTVRIPVTWMYHFVSGYTVDPVWMSRVTTVVNWALARNMTVILNAHHENWIYNDYTNQLPKLESLWAQISTNFESEPSNLIFEILNEPQSNMNNIQVNDMNSNVLAVIRQTNPARTVIIGADSWNAEYELNNGFVIPNDPHLAVTFHYYNPYNFCGNAQGTWGTSSDYATLAGDMTWASNWSAQHGNIPILMGEYGAEKECDPTSRYAWYDAICKYANNDGISYAAWDDDGDFGIFKRTSPGSFDDNILTAIFFR